MAQRLFESMQRAFRDEARPLARLRARKDEAHRRGPTEFEVRDAVHRRGAHALPTARNERQKGATKGPA